jgi:hypothetical protein
MTLRSDRKLPAVLLAGAAAAVALGATTPAKEAPTRDGSVIRAFLTAEIEAARSVELYLVYVPAESRLELRAEGVSLTSFPVTDATFARPRGEGSSAAWPALSFRLVSEPPARERPTIVPASSEGAGAAAGVPEAPVGAGGGVDFATREREARLASVPASYRLRFSPGLDLVVDASASGRKPFAVLARRWSEHVQGARRLLGGSPRFPELTLRLAEPKARRLVFVLSPGIRLLVEPAEVTAGRGPGG